MPGADALERHHLYRAMAWLGEALDDQSGATRAPRRTKDLIEEALFDRRRSLFSDLSVVLFDTSLMFTGAGGAQARRDAAAREAILASLRTKLAASFGFSLERAVFATVVPRVKLKRLYPAM